MIIVWSRSGLLSSNVRDTLVGRRRRCTGTSDMLMLYDEDFGLL